MQLRTVHGDPRPDKVREMREVSAYQVLQIGSLPLVPTQQVLVGGERLDALRESPDKALNIASRGLAGDCLHETEQVLDAMVGLTHQKMKLLLGTLARGNVLNHSHEIVDRPIAFAHAAAGQTDPDDRPVLAQVTFLHAVAVDPTVF